MTSTSLAARIGVALAAGATAAILTAVPAAASTASRIPPDCVTLANAEKALTAAQDKAAAARRDDEDAQSKLTTDQAKGASKTVIDADEAALGTAQSKMILANNAVYTAQGTVESAKESIQRDGVTCPPDGSPNPTEPTKPTTKPTKPTKPSHPGQGDNGWGPSSGGSNQSVNVDGGNASSSAQVTTVVDPTVVLDPVASDGSQATTSGTEVTDVPTGSASTGAA